MRLVHVDPRSLSEAWPLVVADIRKCMEHDSSGAELSDVYSEIANERASLLLAYDDDEYCGMAVVQRHRVPWSSRLALHIWYCQGRNGAGALLDDIDEIARREGAHYLSFSCATEALRRLGESKGFETVEIVMRREVNYGISE